jgi:hypothetical protein
VVRPALPENSSGLVRIPINVLRKRLQGGGARLAWITSACRRVSASSPQTAQEAG